MGIYLLLFGWGALKNKKILYQEALRFKENGKRQMEDFTLGEVWALGGGGKSEREEV
jgi:hypothetical protein